MDTEKRCDECGLASREGFSQTWIAGKLKSEYSDVKETLLGDVVRTTDKTYGDFSEVEVFLCKACSKQRAAKENAEDRKNSLYALLAGPPLLLAALLMGLYGSDSTQKGAIVPGILGVVILLVGIIGLSRHMFKSNVDDTPYPVDLGLSKAKAEGYDTIWSRGVQTA